MEAAGIAFVAVVIAVIAVADAIVGGGGIDGCVVRGLF